MSQIGAPARTGCSIRSSQTPVPGPPRRAAIRWRACSMRVHRHAALAGEPGDRRAQLPGTVSSHRTIQVDASIARLVVRLRRQTFPPARPYHLSVSSCRAWLALGRPYARSVAMEHAPFPTFPFFCAPGGIERCKVPVPTSQPSTPP